MPASPDLCDADPSALSIEAALQRLREQLPIIRETQTVPLSAALGRIAATDLTAKLDSPPFRSSAMDGYTFRHADADADAGQRLRIAAVSSAGHPGPDSLPAGACQRIMTGARVPDAADTVVMQENVTVESDWITINKLPAAGTHVRDVGSDMRQGQLLVSAGQRLGAAALGLLSANGYTQVDVLRPVRVAVLSTGDELAGADAPLQAGQIHDANRAVLLALLDRPAVQTRDLGICGDRVTALQEAIRQATDADLIVSSGGVSVGDADFVRDVIDEQGRVEMWKIAMKPGRPLTFGLLDRGQAWLGLPGNPVSAAVTCLMFVLAALDHMTGTAVAPLLRLPATVDDDLGKLPGRVEYQRGQLYQDDSGNWHVRSTGAQDSHVLTSLQRADCFIELPLDSSGLRRGETAVTIPFTSFAATPV